MGEMWSSQMFRKQAAANSVHRVRWYLRDVYKRQPYGRRGEAKLRRKFFAKLSFKKAGRAGGRAVSYTHLEANKPEAIAKMKAAIDAPGIEVKELPCRYPQGAEKVLIENCTGREVPFPGLPSDVGVIVMNVTSVAFVSKYLETGMPLTTKRLTVDGDIVKEPKNVEVLIGTPIQEVFAFCGLKAVSYTHLSLSSSSTTLLIFRVFTKSSACWYRALELSLIHI